MITEIIMDTSMMLSLGIGGSQVRIRSRRRRSQGILLELTVVHSQRRLCAFEAVVVRYPRIKLLCPLHSRRKHSNYTLPKAVFRLSAFNDVKGWEIDWQVSDDGGGKAASHRASELWAAVHLHRHSFIPAAPQE